MKNIIEICKEFGLVVPPERHRELYKKIHENYITKAEHEKKMQKLREELTTGNQRNYPFCIGSFRVQSPERLYWAQYTRLLTDRGQPGINKCMEDMEHEKY